MVRVLETPTPTGFGENDFVITGGAMTSNVPTAGCALTWALAVTTPPAGMILSRGPGLFPTTVTFTVQEVPAGEGMVPPLNAPNDTKPSPGFAVTSGEPVQVVDELGVEALTIPAG